MLQSLPVAPDEPQKQNRKQYALNLVLAGFAGQVGFVTLAIVVAALLLGLWLDSSLGTRPLFTILILLASVPVTLWVMFRVAMGFVARIKPSASAGPTRSAPKGAGDE